MYQYKDLIGLLRNILKPRILSVFSGWSILLIALYTFPGHRRLKVVFFRILPEKCCPSWGETPYGGFGIGEVWKNLFSQVDAELVLPFTGPKFCGEVKPRDVSISGALFMVVTPNCCCGVNSLCFCEENVPLDGRELWEFGETNAGGTSTNFVAALSRLFAVGSVKPNVGCTSGSGDQGDPKVDMSETVVNFLGRLPPPTLNDSSSELFISGFGDVVLIILVFLVVTVLVGVVDRVDGGLLTGGGGVKGTVRVGVCGAYGVVVLVRTALTDVLTVEYGKGNAEVVVLPMGMLKPLFTAAESSCTRSDSLFPLLDIGPSIRTVSAAFSVLDVFVCGTAATNKEI